MKLTKIQEKRLLNVAKALRDAAAARKRFDMGTFVFGTFGLVKSNYDCNTETTTYCNTEANFCGTPACALGHYAARTDMQRLLKVAYLKDKYKGNVEYAAIAFFGEEADQHTTCPQYDDPKFVKHFGLDYSEMDELFGGDGCGGAHTAIQAAKYIEKFVKSKRSTHEAFKAGVV